jgi:hypothetical protein
MDISRFKIIDDSNAAEYATQVADGAMSSGYVARNYARNPFGFYAPRYAGEVIPRSQWSDLIKRQDDNQTSPEHWAINGKVPILNQNGLPYCWMYGVVGAVMCAYAQTGRLAPHLSATGPAAQGKGWREQGGWAGEAIEYIEKFGIPELKYWPEHSMDLSLPSREDVKASSTLHKTVKFKELPSQNFDIAMSVLLDPVNPRSVTLGLSWWGHLVYATKAVEISRGKFGMLIRNSWDYSWESEGKVVLVENKATAHEYVAIDTVTQYAAAA